MQMIPVFRILTRSRDARPRLARFIATHVFVASLTVFAALSSAPVRAQDTDEEYKWKEILSYENAQGQTIDLRAVGQDRRKLLQFIGILRQGQINNETDRAVFEDCFQYYVAALTWQENVSRLPAERSNLKRTLFFSAGSAPVGTLYDDLNDRVLASMQTIAKDPLFHPAVRYNAVLMIGDLNQEESTSNLVAAPPLAKTFPVLWDFVKDTEADAVLRVGAMIGLERHVVAGTVPDADRPEVVQELVRLVTEPRSEKRKLRRTQNWMRRRAVDLLKDAAAGWPAASTPEVASALRERLANPKTEITARCDAASALGMLQPSAFNQGAVKSMAGDVAGLVAAVATLSAETKRNMPKPPPAPPAANPLLNPPPTVDVPPVKHEYLAYFLGCTKDALVGATTSGGRGLISAAANDDARTFINDLVKRIDTLIVLLSNKSMTETQLAQRLEQEGQAIAAWREQNAPAVATAAAPTRSE